MPIKGWMVVLGGLVISTALTACGKDNHDDGHHNNGSMSCSDFQAWSASGVRYTQEGGSMVAYNGSGQRYVLTGQQMQDGFINRCANGVGLNGGQPGYPPGYGSNGYPNGPTGYPNGPLPPGNYVPAQPMAIPQGGMMPGQPMMMPPGYSNGARQPLPQRYVAPGARPQGQPTQAQQPPQQPSMQGQYSTVDPNDPKYSDDQDWVK